MYEKETPLQNQFEWNIFFREKYISKPKIDTLTVQNNLKLKSYMVNF